MVRNIEELLNWTARSAENGRNHHEEQEDPSRGNCHCAQPQQSRPPNRKSLSMRHRKPPVAALPANHDKARARAKPHTSLRSKPQVRAALFSASADEFARLSRQAQNSAGVAGRRLAASRAKAGVF